MDDRYRGWVPSKLMWVACLFAFISGIGVGQLVGEATSATSGSGYSTYAGLPQRVIGTQVKARVSVTRSFRTLNTVRGRAILLRGGVVVSSMVFSRPGSRVLQEVCRPGARYVSQVTASVYRPDGRFIRSISHRSPVVIPC